jgi:hypothetical protein
VRVPIALSLVEPGPGIFVFPAGSPLAPALLALSRATAAGPLGLLWCVPHATARKPFHHHVGILSLQLMKGRL